MISNIRIVIDKEQMSLDLKEFTKKLTFLKLFIKTTNSVDTNGVQTQLKNLFLKKYESFTTHKLHRVTKPSIILYRYDIPQIGSFFKKLAEKLMTRKQ